MDVWFKNTRPNIIYLKLIDEIFALIHKSIPSDQTEQQDVVKMLDIVIPTNLPKLVEEFDKLNDRYKSQYTKYSNVE